MVNFNYILSKAQMHWQSLVCTIQFHQQNYTQLFQLLQLEATPNLYTSRFTPGVGNSFWLAGHIGNKIDSGHYKYDKDLFKMTFEKNGLLAVHFLKRSI